jgi:hypothetical protein
MYLYQETKMKIIDALNGVPGVSEADVARIVTVLATDSVGFDCSVEPVNGAFAHLGRATLVGLGLTVKQVATVLSAQQSGEWAY